MEKKDFKAESKRLMELMINSIYTHKEIFLREIISNASDALDKLHFISLTDEKAQQLPELYISITADKESRTLKVSDNGIGMNREELEEMGLAEGLQSLVMTAEETESGLRYLYKLKEAPPPPSSHARAVVAAKGVTLEAMVAALSQRGLDMRSGDPGWDKIRRGAV